MGHEILYCSACQKQLRGVEFDKGQAFRIGHRACCAVCAPGLVRSLPPAEMQELLKQMAAKGPSRAAGSLTPKTPRAPIKAVPKASVLPLALAAGGGAVVVVVVIVLMSRGSPSPPPPPKAVAQAPEPPRKSVAEDAGRELIRDIAELDARARPLTDREAFRDAIAVYESARAKRAGAEWKALLEGKAGDLRKEAARRLDTLLPAAEAAKKEGRAEELAKTRARVAGWGLPESAAALDARLASIPEPDVRRWEPIFDGRTLSALNAGDHRDFRVENGVLYRKNSNGAAQSARAFDDGEIRVRFEAHGGTFLSFSVRQCAEGRYNIFFDALTIVPLLLKQHELVFRCEGDVVTATLDGQPVPVVPDGRPKRGHFQFKLSDGELRIFALEYRPLR